MNYKLTYMIILMGFLSCKNEEKTLQKEINNEPIPHIKTNDFEESLLMLKDVNVKFNDSFKIRKFGAKKKNDSVFSFIMRLEDNVTKQQVKKYSIGLRSYSFELKDSSRYLKRDYMPEVITKHGAKYIILNQKIDKVRYFDSIEAYIYKRKDWKAAGRLGTIIIKDILLEEKNK